MAFYDHFSQKEKMPTKAGLKLVKLQNKRIYKILSGFVNKKEIDILEIGPGRGAFAEECKINKAEYVAIEINQKLASDLSANGIDIVKSKVPPLPFKPDTFDVVYMNQVFEHMNDIDMAQQMIDECNRILKKDGLLCIISPDYLVWKEEFFNGDYTHNFITTARRLEEIYYDHNLRVANISYICGPFFGDMFTWLLGFFNGLLMRQKFIHRITFGLISTEKVYKARTTFFRSVMVVGVKNE
ncbi:class I SAM-dependent methyltransferase [Methanolobus sp. ZRKC2]|uniref:class I SAM-dependent methyltransferase n=1 Tax=Methanolobus sp. ZRKC2 TaxID=3125783 RepID=UPI003251AC9B